MIQSMYYDTVRNTVSTEKLEAIVEGLEKDIADLLAMRNHLLEADHIAEMSGLMDDDFDSYENLCWIQRTIERCEDYKKEAEERIREPE